MKIRSLTLGSAAFAGTLLFAGAALAAPDDYYNTNPTPTERAQTDQLNGNAAATAHGDADANDAAHSNYDAARSDYDRNRDAYDAMLAAHANPSIGGQIDRDEENFLDRTKTRFFIVEEHGATA